MSNVTVRGGMVEKRGAPKLLEIEAVKMERARAIGIASGLFRVPRLLDLDVKRGVLRMEYLDQLRGIRNVPLSQARGPALMSRVGAALCTVHNQLRLPQEMVVPLPPNLEQGGDRVFLHGDFSVENVCLVGGEDGELVLIDWQMTPRFGGMATHGSRCFDAAWFIGNLFRKPVYKYIGSLGVERAADGFLAGYASQLQPNATLVGFRAYLSRLLDIRLETQERGLSPLKRILLSHGFRAWRRYADTVNFPELTHA